MTKQDDTLGLTHINAQGRTHMVDVSGKPVTVRQAVAEARVRVSSELIERLEAGSLVKGNLLEVARLAGIQGGKRTSELIPLCHTLSLDHLDVEARIEGNDIYLRSIARTTARTGVEMEALTAVTVAALTVIDMGKAVDKRMVIHDVRLLEKSGGQSGDFRLEARADEGTEADR